MIRIALFLIGLVITILGVHGIYVYANTIELFCNWDNADKLFLSIDLSFVSSQILWMTEHSIESWLTPAGITLGGIIIITKFRII